MGSSIFSSSLVSSFGADLYNGNLFRFTGKKALSMTFTISPTMMSFQRFSGHFRVSFQLSTAAADDDDFAILLSTVEIHRKFSGKLTKL